MARAATLRATAWFLLAAPLCSSFTVGGGRGWLQRPGSVGSRSSGSRVARDMFSGIVEEMGEVVSLESNEAMELWDGSVGEGTELVIKAGVALDGAYEGASICVNGVCTTVVTYDSATFKVGLAPETLRRSDLGSLKAGDAVNLERALAADGRNSGHCVQGHVDCTGEILSRHMEGESLWVKIAPQDKDLMRFIVPKGFIAVDGTSLTVCDVTDESFTLMLIEHTQKCIVLPLREIGDAVNLEVDVIAKYARRSVGDFEALSKRVADLEAKLDKLAA